MSFVASALTRRCALPVVVAHNHVVVGHRIPLVCAPVAVLRVLLIAEVASAPASWS